MPALASLIKVLHASSDDERIILVINTPGLRPAERSSTCRADGSGPQTDRLHRSSGTTAPSSIHALDSFPPSCFCYCTLDSGWISLIKTSGSRCRESGAGNDTVQHQRIVLPLHFVFPLSLSRSVLRSAHADNVLAGVATTSVSGEKTVRQ